MKRKLKVAVSCHYVYCSAQMMDLPFLVGRGVYLVRVFFVAGSSGIVLWKLSFSWRKEQVIFWQQLFYHISCSKLSLISVGDKSVSLKTYPFFITAINNPSTT